MPLRHLCYLILALVFSCVTGRVSADIVLRDTISDGGFNTVPVSGVLNTSSGFGPNSGLIDSTVGIAFVGNGQSLETVDVIFQYGSNDGLNTGNIQQFSWQLSLFLDPVDFSTAGALGRSGSVAPDFMTVVADPINSDYATPIGMAGLANNHLASFDLGGLGWTTTNGHNHILTVVPVTTMAGSNTVGALAYSPVTTSPLDLFDQAFDNGTPPETFAQRGLPFDSVAARITAAVPEPSSLLLITLCLPTFLRRRR